MSRLDGIARSSTLSAVEVEDRTPLLRERDRLETSTREFCVEVDGDRGGGVEMLGYPDGGPNEPETGRDEFFSNVECPSTKRLIPRESRAACRPSDAWRLTFKKSIMSVPICPIVSFSRWLNLG